jgi:putative phosphoesterase
VRVAALYDIHGNLPALDAVLASARADETVIGGDIVLGGNSRAALDRVMSLGARCIRGNCDRLVVEAFDGHPPPARLPLAVQEDITRTAQSLDRHHRDFLASLPETIIVGPVLFCHGSPRSDDEAITAESLAGVTQSMVVCGHTHQQFDRTMNGIRVVNAGSVGMPFESAPGAYWLLLDPDVHLECTNL